MKKPEKKQLGEVGLSIKTGRTFLVGKVKGYNQAYDEWERFLPDVEEIGEIILEVFWDKCGGNFSAVDIAQAIAKRIGKLGGDDEN